LGKIWFASNPYHQNGKGTFIKVDHPVYVLQSLSSQASARFMAIHLCKNCLPKYIISGLKKRSTGRVKLAKEPLSRLMLGILNAKRKIRKRTDTDVAFTREYSRVSIFHRKRECTN